MEDGLSTLSALVSNSFSDSETSYQDNINGVEPRQYNFVSCEDSHCEHGGIRTTRRQVWHDPNASMVTATAGATHKTNRHLSKDMSTYGIDGAKMVRCARIEVGVEQLDEAEENFQTITFIPKALIIPLGSRWAISAPHVDFSGSWTLKISPAFKIEYDAYLKALGINLLIRGIALAVISQTFEVTKQMDQGRQLYILGSNPKGSWERTLVASGSDLQHSVTDGTRFRHYQHEVRTADKEKVIAKAWWENMGTLHRSFLTGGTKYGGGDFESKRYLEEGGGIYVCESIFHPTNSSKKKACVTWRFVRS